MAYWNRPTSNFAPSLDTISLSMGMRKGKVPADEFYEIEPAIVLDIILDKDHPYFQEKKYKLVSDQWPVDVNGKQPAKDDNHREGITTETG